MSEYENLKEQWDKATAKELTKARESVILDLKKYGMIICKYDVKNSMKHDDLETREIMMIIDT